jgi:hypothetical protein
VTPWQCAVVDLRELELEFEREHERRLDDDRREAA